MITDRIGFHSVLLPLLIIAKFVRRDLATDLYRSPYKLKGKTTNDINFDSFQTRGGNKIFIQESLTPARKKLFRSCLKVKKELDYNYVSTSNGRIYMKKFRSSQPICIKNTNDLAKLRDLHRKDQG